MPLRPPHGAPRGLARALVVAHHLPPVGEGVAAAGLPEVGVLARRRVELGPAARRLGVLVVGRVVLRELARPPRRRLLAAVVVAARPQALAVALLVLLVELDELERLRERRAEERRLDLRGDGDGVLEVDDAMAPELGDDGDVARALDALERRRLADALLVLLALRLVPLADLHVGHEAVGRREDEPALRAVDQSVPGRVVEVLRRARALDAERPLQVHERPDPRRGVGQRRVVVVALEREAVLPGLALGALARLGHPVALLAAALGAAAAAAAALRVVRGRVLERLVDDLGRRRVVGVHEPADVVGDVLLGHLRRGVAAEDVPGVAAAREVPRLHHVDVLAERHLRVAEHARELLGVGDGGHRDLGLAVHLLEARRRVGRLRARPSLQHAAEDHGLVPRQVVQDELDGRVARLDDVEVAMI
mmetsp:Transcript_13424/g.46012  ORF Transcript_13424/g.46012 Transcript_13424/m.46012 type:complete len:422 (-) Transcript_13424:2795-4060(-)